VEIFKGFPNSGFVGSDEAAMMQQLEL